MSKIKGNQSGFGTVEIILVIVIVVLLGAVGWFVYDRNQNKTMPVSTTTPTTSTTPTKSQSSTLAQDTYLTVKLNTSLGFKEQSIKFKLSSDINDAYYVTGSAGTAISVKSLDSVRGCKADENLNGVAGLAYDIGTGSQSSFASRYPNAVQIGQDWVAIAKAPSPCSSDDTTTQTKIDNVVKAFEAASKTIVVVQ